MSKYQGLLNLDSDDPITVTKPAKKTKVPKKQVKLGCDGCPLNKEGCVKIIGLSRVTGKKVFIWTQYPGRQEVNYIWTDENGVKRKGLELVGPAGDFLWRHLGQVGIDREDCDVQNVLRCRPTEYDEERGWERDRKPTKEELKHCSIYNEKAIIKNGGKAKVHIVFGLVAAAAVLGKEYKKGSTVQWSDRLKAKVITIAHPAYFLRDGYSRSKYRQFRQGLKMAAEIVTGKTQSRFSFVEALDLAPICKPDTFAQFARNIRKAAIEKKERCMVDIETGKKNDQEIGLCMGFCFDKNFARTVYIDKSDAPVKERGRMLEIMGEVLEDEKIEFGAHHYVADKPAAKRLWSINIKNMTYDTEYASYFTGSDRKKHGLAEIAEVDFPQFAGYKEIIAPYVKDDEGDFLSDANYDLIPFKVMTIYNGTDALLSKKKEIQTRGKFTDEMMRLYMEAGWEIDGMHFRGPNLDLPYWEQMAPMLEKRMEVILQRMAVISGNPNHNPGSYTQVRDVLFRVLKLPLLKDKKGNDVELSDYETLEFLAQQYPKHAEYPKLTNEYRGLQKMHGTYLTGYKKSADTFDGEIRSNWWITGTGTYRLRSSGNKRGRMAMQNLHNDTMLQNMLVSDVNWRKILKAGEYDLIG